MGRVRAMHGAVRDLTHSTHVDLPGHIDRPAVRISDVDGNRPRLPYGIRLFSGPMPLDSEPSLGESRLSDAHGRLAADPHHYQRFVLGLNEVLEARFNFSEVYENFDAGVDKSTSGISKPEPVTAAYRGGQILFPRLSKNDLKAMTPSAILKEYWSLVSTIFHILDHVGPIGAAVKAVFDEDVLKDLCREETTDEVFLSTNATLMIVLRYFLDYAGGLWGKQEIPQGLIPIHADDLTYLTVNLNLLERYRDFALLVKLRDRMAADEVSAFAEKYLAHLQAASPNRKDYLCLYNPPSLEGPISVQPVLELFDNIGASERLKLTIRALGGPLGEISPAVLSAFLHAIIGEVNTLDETKLPARVVHPLPAEDLTVLFEPVTDAASERELAIAYAKRRLQILSETQTYRIDSREIKVIKTYDFQDRQRSFYLVQDGQNEDRYTSFEQFNLNWPYGDQEPVVTEMTFAASPYVLRQYRHGDLQRVTWRCQQQTVVPKNIDDYPRLPDGLQQWDDLASLEAVYARFGEYWRGQDRRLFDHWLKQGDGTLKPRFLNGTFADFQNTYGFSVNEIGEGTEGRAFVIDDAAPYVLKVMSGDTPEEAAISLGDHFRSFLRLQAALETRGETRIRSATVYAVGQDFLLREWVGHGFAIRERMTIAWNAVGDYEDEPIGTELRQLYKHVERGMYYLHHNPGVGHWNFGLSASSADATVVVYDPR